MKKFEHLFSQDPIGAFEKIEQDYVRYFEAAYKIDKDAYKIGDMSLDEERVKLLSKDSNMSKEPYIEILPEYAPASGLSNMKDLVAHFAGPFGNTELSQTFFEDFIAKGLMCGLMEKYIPYGHQIGMLEKAFAGIDDNGRPLKYRNTVITSGTGSGKTESFLLPLLADIYKEAQNWNTAADHTDWYIGELDGRSSKRRYTPKQRINDSRPAAIRAIVLYPMNALVEDQMARLREALDSDEIRNYMQEQLKGNRIYFGSYNGSTIAPKNYDLLSDPSVKTATRNKKREEVAKQLKDIHDHFEFIETYVKKTPNKRDALYISPRLGGSKTTSEMITRWDMQYWAPDIMITNTSMLSIMLMRKAERQMFEDTRKWLAAEDLPEELREEAKKNRIFHIVVDELHLYRGTAGSEVACLLRMLYNAIGLSPVIDEKNENGVMTGNKIPNPQIKILASSASLGDENQTQDFMEQFFGVYSTIESERVFNVQSGSDYIDTLKNEDLPIDYSKFAFFTHDDFVALDKEIKKDEQERILQVFKERLNKVNEFVSANFECSNVQEFVAKYQQKIFWDFYKVMPENNDGDPKKDKKSSIRPISMSNLCKKLFDDNEKALRGFLIFRGFIDEIPELKNNHKLPRFRFHKFFKYIEGLWGELNPNVSGESPIAHLSYTAKEVGPNNRKVLELLRCENCGQLFIGGNRKKDINNGNISLTLNYPNLDQIPNFNPTPMVQNKNYRDYAIFWPHDINKEVRLEEGHVNQGAEDHVVEIGTSNTNYGSGQAKWFPGYLDSVTGDFISLDRSTDSRTQSLRESIKRDGIPGFIYRVVNQNTDNEIDDLRASKIYAAPCTCPHCQQNYTLRKYTNSPIRSFRTGIDRSTQILSKELLYQLDEKSAKLIGFSDSREDAAKQALGIEKEQYRDMVRMLFVECVNEIGINDIVIFIKQGLSEHKKRSEIRKEVIKKWRRPDIEEVINAIFDAVDDNDYTDLERFSQNNIPLSNLIGNGFDGILVRKLLEYGINPAGELYKFQWYQERNNNSRLYHWSEAYDFKEFKLRDDVDFENNNYRNEIRNQLENAVFANSFGKYMGVSVLDAGIGYICGPQSDSIITSDEYNALRRLLPQTIEVYDFVDAFIRVMGDNYLYPSNDESIMSVTYNQLKGAIKRPIRKFCNKNGLDETILGDALTNYLKKYCTDRDLLSLNLSKLSFTKMKNDKYIICTKCGRVHPNMGFGFCTNTSCMESLDPNNTVKTEALHDHYISFDILKEKKKPRRLHTEELSGQTDDIQSRLREFKDLILIDDNDPTKLGKEMTMPIDMVCVTTTMEVGVDIGSLQAIFQGNMPPTRYNYQQRVGRGGRRGQAYSTAFTFCRGRSHDVYYYDKATDEMVGGIPATPTLSLAPYKEKDGSVKMKIAIMKRVVVKEILKQAYADLPYKYELQDTAGEFGTVGEWKTTNDQGKTTEDILKEWLEKPVNIQVVEDVIHRYFDQFNNDGQIDSDILEITRWITNDLVGQIANVVKKTSAEGKGLAQYLTETGFLPRYGMPSDSRNFYHGFDSVYKTVKSVDRSSEMAITEFAPGAEKTKDKGKYRIEGLTIPIKEETDDRGQLSFYDPQGDALADRYIISFEKNIGEHDNNIKDISEAPANIPVDNVELNDSQRLIVIPQAYRSIEIKNNTGTPIENNDKGSSFTQSVIYARDNYKISDDPNQKSNKRTIQNVDISMYELGLNEDPTVWHVNSNNGKFYKGTYHVNVDAPFGGSSNFMFYKKDNTNKEINPVNDGVEIALGAKKITEMVKIELKEHPDKLNLSLETGNRSAIRAAFYSAAFLLQRALADKLDVQPDEIEICEKIDEQHEYPSIYLSDALPNGAGIVSYLFQDGKLEELIRSIINFDTFDPFKTSKDESFMHSLILHRDECLTACQKCLMTYSNRGFHHILDWRLGVGLLRLMLDKYYDFGFETENRNNYEELKDWDKIISACAKKLNLRVDNLNQSYWIKDGDCTIIYHPLWKREKVYEAINEQYTSLRMFNTFKLLRSELSEDRDNNAPQYHSGGNRLINRIRRKKNSTSNTIQPTNPIVDDEDDDEL